MTGRRCCMACVLQGASNFFADEGEMCGDWSANLIGAQALTVFAALTLAAINTVLKEVLHCTCRAASLAKPSTRARVCVCPLWLLTLPVACCCSPRVVRASPLSDARE